MPRLVLALCLLAAACAAPPPPQTDPRLLLTLDLGLLADPIVMGPGPGVRAQVRLVNPTGADRPVLVTTEWATAAGMPVRTLLSAPRRMTVPRYGDTFVDLLAPNPQAVQFRIRVEPDTAN